MSVRQFRSKRKPVSKIDSKDPRPVVPLDANLSPAPWSSLLRPVLFTAAFSGGSLAACAIWQYENMRSEAIRVKTEGWGWKREGRRKVGEFREMVRKWWTGLSEGEKLYWPLCGANILVFLAWRIPSLQPFMMKWFLGNPAAKATCLPLLLSAFSHYSLLHLGANMMVLHSFMPTGVALLGKEQFLAVYLNACVISSLASMVYKVGMRNTSFSLGASGAICTVLSMFAVFFPDAKLSIIFLPMYTFSAASAVKGLMLIDSAGLVFRWSFFDHAAHLSGMLFGMFWAKEGCSGIWGQREGLVTAWHKLRNSYD